MEEILASIRRIIAEDEQESPSSGAAMPQPLRPVPAMQDESTPREWSPTRLVGRKIEAAEPLFPRLVLS